jgi:alkylhydroperoxidase family enzyme
MKILCKGRANSGSAMHVDGLTSRSWAVVRYANAMTLHPTVSDDVFDELKGHFTTKGIVELTASIAGCNPVSRFVRALDNGEKNNRLSD